MIVILALLGGYAGFKLNREVRIYSTSIIGAGFLLIGVSSFVGGLPDFLNLGSVTNKELKKVTPIYAAYIVGLIAISVSGIYVQLKYTEKIESKEDDFMDPNKFA